MKFKPLFIRCAMVALIGAFLVVGTSLPAFSKTYRWQPSSWLPSGIT